MTINAKSNRSVIAAGNAATVSLFDMVANTAGAASQLITSTTTAIDMLDRFVTDAHTRQVARSVADLDTFYERLANDTSLDNAAHNLNIQEQLAANPQLKANFTEEHTRITALLSKLRNPE